MVEGVVNFFSRLNPVLSGLIGGLVITLMNAVGALAVILWRKPSERFLDGSLGFAAGVMLTASFTSLILPGVECAGGAVLPVIFGMLLGILVLDQADHWIPHLHAVMGHEGPRTARIRAAWLFIIAITLHNMPEGLAVGVGFGSGNISDALKLMLAIGVQNVPEGLACAVSALNAGMGKYLYSASVGARAGLVEIPLALLGAFAVTLVKPLLPYAMGFAAGAMLYVISDEIVPETHSRGNERIATLGMMVGIAIMLYLDVALG